MIVVLVATLLITMSVGSIINSLRLLAVQRTASDVMVAAQTARQLALQENDTDIYYGVEIVDDPSNPDGAYVAVISGDGSSGTGPDVLISDEDRDGDGANDPVCKLPITSSVVIWRGATDLRQVANSQAHLALPCHRNYCVAWFYRGATGKVHARQTTKTDGLTDYSFAVGLKPRSLHWAYGKDYGNEPIPDLAPGETDTDGTYHPGISLRSPDDHYRFAISIYPNGAGFTSDFSAGTEGD
jgi:hypothetical protein